MTRPLFPGCSALITGASAGLGREFARQLAPEAAQLLLVARRSERLEELRAQLASQHPALKVHCLSIDLARDGAILELAAELERREFQPDLLINNAGLGDIGPLHNSDAGRIRDIVMVNMVALTLLTRAVLPGMVERRAGTIINVSSCAAYLPIAGFAVYAATKAYVSSFSEGIRAELRGTGVRITALCPGPVHTEFTSVAKRRDVPARLGPELAYVSAENVVRDALQAAAADRPVVIPGFLMQIAMSAVRLLPMPAVRVVARLYAKSS